MIRKVSLGWLGLFSLAIGLLGSENGYANVSLKNGNFFIGYTDIVYPGGFEPKVERVYNSKTGYRGMFGHGWGTEYEVFLTVSADGSVVVHEYGGGAENRFLPRNFKKKDLNAAVNRIAAAAKKLGMLPSKRKADSYKKKLRTDAIFRNDEWERFVRQGKLKRRKLRPKTRLYSNRFSFQFIEKKKRGYKRIFDNGRVETFGENGKLLQIADKNSNYINFKYDKNGILRMLEDDKFRKMTFTFNSQGLLIRVDGQNGKRAVYKYNKRGELVYSKDVDGNVYTYAYSKDGRHNLTMIGYSDKTKMLISYYNRKLNENVKKVVDRDGTSTHYSYKFNKRNRDKFTVGVGVKDSKGKRISDSSYSYTMKTKKNGERWTYRMASNVDGQKTVTTYNECCGLPIIIKKGKRTTRFKYDKKGHVVWKDTPTETVALKYHKSFGKVIKVNRTSKLTKRKRWSTFKYDKKGNLQLAKNSNKKSVFLHYDRKGRIARMVDQSKREIRFKYDENSKPTEIQDPKLGKIRVTYSNTGEVKKVDSDAGRKIALQVTSAFQNLLDIIRPAGVTLAF